MTTAFQIFKNKLQAAQISLVEIWSRDAEPIDVADKIHKVRAGGQNLIIEEFENTKEVLIYSEVQIENITNKE